MSDDQFKIVANYTYDWESWFLPDGRIRWINPAVGRMTGYSVDECLAMDAYPLPIVHEDDRAAVKQLLDAALAGTSGNDVEFRIRRKDGGIGWAAVSWQPMLAEGGKRLGVRTSMRDISRRKSAEEALRLAKIDAERANEAKTRFLAAASHDLRQPLQAIAMYTGVLGSRQLDADTQDILTHIRLCLAAGNELLEDLVDISRLDAGIVVPKFAEVALADMLETIDTSFRREAETRKIDLRLVPTSLFVRADPAILSRILQNLVSNALRYTPVGRVLVGCRRRGSHVDVEVWDTGVGIPPEQTGRIFEEFYQIDNQARDRRRGVGLGLAIVRRKAALMNAEVKVRSTPGKGSVFAVTLPLADSGRLRQAPPQERDARSYHGLSIAVIEDEPLQLSAMRAFLKQRQADVIAARSIREAMAALDGETRTLDLIIADFRLESGVTGAHAVAALRARFGRAIPAIIITGDTEPTRLVEAQASGCVLLHKPVDPNDLAKTIADLTIGGA